MSSAKAANAIEMPFALKTLVGPRNHILDVAERVEPNTVLWVFHIIPPSSFILFYMCGRIWSIETYHSIMPHLRCRCRRTQEAVRTVLHEYGIANAYE